jgi:hypothetical protein
MATSFTVGLATTQSEYEELDEFSSSSIITTTTTTNTSS